MSPARRVSRVSRATAAAAAVLALAVTAGAAGCSDEEAGADPTGTGTSGTSAGGWPSNSDPVARDGLVYAAGTTVHLGDGRTLDVGVPVGRFVVAGDGVFFTDADHEDPDLSTGPYGGAPPLLYADRDAEGDPEEVASAVGSLRASPDGRHLVLIDLGAGEEDDFGTPQAQVVVVDLASGEEVVRSVEGMGDPGSDDLAALYPEAEPSVVAVTDDEAYVHGSDGDLHGFDLESGEVTTVDDAEVPTSDPFVSPSGDQTIVDVYAPSYRDTVRTADGAVVRPSLPDTRTLTLQGWLDDETVVGVSGDRPVRNSVVPEGATYTFVTCEIPSGRCEPVPDAGDGSAVVRPETSG